MKRLTFILLLSIFASSVYAINVYKWVDKEGMVSFTEDYNKVPSIYRDHVEELNISEEKPKMGPSSPSQTPIEQKEGAAKDIYGRDEASWRERVRPWKEQLKQATVNYEAANER
jgi:hypothetical protein